MGIIAVPAHPGYKGLNPALPLAQQFDVQLHSRWSGPESPGMRAAAEELSPRHKMRTSATWTLAAMESMANDMADAIAKGDVPRCNRTLVLMDTGPNDPLDEAAECIIRGTREDVPAICILVYHRSSHTHGYGPRIIGNAAAIPYLEKMVEADRDFMDAWCRRPAKTLLASGRMLVQGEAVFGGLNAQVYEVNGVWRIREGTRDRILAPIEINFPNSKYYQPRPIIDRLLTACELAERDPNDLFQVFLGWRTLKEGLTLKSSSHTNAINQLVVACMTRGRYGVLKVNGEQLEQASGRACGVLDFKPVAHFREDEHEAFFNALSINQHASRAVREGGASNKRPRESLMEMQLPMDASRIVWPLPHRLLDPKVAQAIIDKAHDCPEKRFKLPVVKRPRELPVEEHFEADMQPEAGVFTQQEIDLLRRIMDLYGEEEEEDRVTGQALFAEIRRLVRPVDDAIFDGLRDKLCRMAYEGKTPWIKIEGVAGRALFVVHYTIDQATGDNWRQCGRIDDDMDNHRDDLSLEYAGQGWNLE
jgi:hypothetical protein